MNNANDKDLPVTLLAGFLGSGKTTLLNYILKENHGKRIAVIENEFGEIAIDHDLVIGADDDIFEMSNGCVCCSIRTDLIETLNRLIKRRERIDHILVECTGIASPGPIAQAFLVEDELERSLKLDGVVTLVDAKHIWNHLEAIEVAWEQIAFSNIILVNKTDLVSPGELDRVARKISQINPTAQVCRTQNAQIDLDRILNIGGFNLDSELNATLEISEPGETGKKEHSHGQEISSVSVSLPGCIDRARLFQWLQMLLIMEGMDVFRAKGILNLKNEDRRYIFQSVYMMFDGQSGRPWGQEPRDNKLVFIGRNLDPDRLKQGVRNCLL